MYIYSKISASLTLVSLISNLIIPQYSLTAFNSDEVNDSDFTFELMPADSLATLQGHALIQTSIPETPKVVTSYWVLVTAYSSTPDQTDSTPFITASGTHVKDGIIACNFLRFGTKVRFPQMYGGKSFVVEDRMALKNSHKIDIWFPSREEAKQFGVKLLKVEVLET